MHAASVHPEPGSNSRKYCIKSPCGVSILSSSFCSSFTFVWVVFSFRIDRDFSSHFFCLLCTYLLLFNFQWPVAARSSLLFGDSIIISHHFAFVKYFFKSFFNFFQVSFNLSQYTPSKSPSRTAFIFYHFLPLLSTLFSKLFSFCRFFIPLYLSIPPHLYPSHKGSNFVQNIGINRLFLVNNTYKKIEVMLLRSLYWSEQ